MRAYSVFDDFPQSSISILRNKGVEVIVHPKGEERPKGGELKRLLDEYDILIISTAQTISEGMFKDVVTPKIIGTASSGVDHIHVPLDKCRYVKIVNAKNANRSTVTEHAFALLLALRKQLLDGRAVAAEGKSKKNMSRRPVELLGSTIGVVGAGGIASSILRMADCWGMKRLCWTLHPENHLDLKADNVEFVDLETLCLKSDNIVVSIPLSDRTNCLVTSSLISYMKDTAAVIVTSRLEVVDIEALFAKAKNNPLFGLAIDADAASIRDLWSIEQNNIIVTPHIAGGTVESRIRLFNECSQNVVNSIL